MYIALSDICILNKVLQRMVYGLNTGHKCVSALPTWCVVKTKQVNIFTPHRDRSCTFVSNINLFSLFVCSAVGNPTSFFI